MQVAGCSFRTASRASRQSLTTSDLRKSNRTPSRKVRVIQQKGGDWIPGMETRKNVVVWPAVELAGVSHHAKGESSSVLAAILLSARRRIPAALTPYKLNPMQVSYVSYRPRNWFGA